MRPRLSRFTIGAWLAIALLCGPDTASALSKAMKVLTDNTVVDITITTWLEYVPATGLVPATVTVHNHTAEPGVWRISSVDQDYISGTMRAAITVSAPARGMTQTNVLLPVMPNYDSANRSYKNLRLTASGPGINMAGFVGTLTGQGTRSTSGSKSRSAFILLSEGFDARHGARWKTKIPLEWNGDVVRMKEAPVDWRGYSSARQIWMQEQEWQEMSRQQREALLAWVAQGGVAYLNTRDSSSDVARPTDSSPWTGQKLDYGLGILHPVTDSIVEKDGPGLVHSNSDLALEKLVNNRVAERDSLQSLVPGLKINGALIFGFILIFGLIVGPINLFWLAAGSKRPRLFLTTPLISCAGTGVLILVMVLQDGFGGTGARVSLAVLLPELKQMTVVQEQFAKTGILIRSAFDLPSSELAWISPVPEYRQTTNRFGRTSTQSEKRDYTLQDSKAVAGWFASRSVQSHLINSQRMNRGTIELGGGDSPYVTSSLNTPLRNFYLQDQQGRLWMAKAVPVGQRTVLSAATTKDLKEWTRNTVKTHMGGLMRTRIDRCLPLQNGSFFAEADEPAKLAVPSLDTIQWARDRAFVTGTFEPAGDR